MGDNVQAGLGGAEGSYSVARLKLLLRGDNSSASLGSVEGCRASDDRFALGATGTASLASDLSDRVPLFGHGGSGVEFRLCGEWSCG